MLLESAQKSARKSARHILGSMAHELLQTGSSLDRHSAASMAVPSEFDLAKCRTAMIEASFTQVLNARTQSKPKQRVVF